MVKNKWLRTNDVFVLNEHKQKIIHLILRMLTITKGEKTMARLATHAGEILADELEELGISASELARSLHIPTNRITQILNGQRGITADTALRLGRWFGTGAELWMNLQKSYELRLAEQLAGEEVQKTITPRLDVKKLHLMEA